MSTSLIGGVVGAAVGFAVGQPQIGWFIGSAIGATFAPTEKVQGQLLTDLRVTGTDYGQCIPYVQGHVRLAPQIWWASDRRPVANVTEEGGKGGGGGGVETTSYTYDVDLLLGLTDNEIVGVARIWDNGKLIYTALSSSDSASLISSQNSDLWERLTVYLGTDDQLPDPTYEAAVGTANAIAYRHRSYVFIQGFHLGPSGQMRNLTFEVATKATTGEVIVATRLYHLNNSLLDAVSGAKTLTLHSGGAFNTTDPKFGAASAGEASANANYYYDTADAGSGDFNFGTGDFTIDCWVDLNRIPDGSTDNQYAAVFGSVAYTGGPGDVTPNANGQYGLLIIGAGGGADAGKLLWQHKRSTGVIRQVFDSGSDPLTVGDQHHLAVIRSGNTIYLTIDGVLQATSATLDATDVISGTTLFAFGGHSSSAPGFYPVGGYQDEVRVVKGAAAWTSFPFEPPTEEYTGNDLNYSYITLLEEDLDDVVSRLCVRAGMEAAQFDVTGLSTITKQVRSLAISQIVPSAQPMALLMDSFYFSCTLSDKIYFRPRGGASVATIPYLELGARQGGSTDGKPSEPFAPKFTSELETPAQIVISYINVDDDYQTGTEGSDRLESALANSEKVVQMAIGLTADEAKGNANTMLWDQVASGAGGVISVLSDYAKVEPTDVVTVTDAEGEEHRIRVVRRTDTWPLLELEYVMDDASVLQDQGITDLDYTPSSVVDATVATIMELMDIPILRDADDDPGFYVATKGSDTPYPGSQVLESVDDVQYTTVATVTESAIIGECTTTLGDWTGPDNFDELNSVTVEVDATLSSSTRAAVIASDQVNAMLIGSEVIQFVTATLVTTGIYTLTRLLRGGRGTEWARTGHVASERCVRLRTAGLRRIDMQTNQIGDELYYKGVTIGRRLSSATSETFTNNAIGLKPFSPTNLRAFQNVSTGDITITCLLRSRLATRGLSTTSQSIPLGEDSAAGELDIATIASPGVILRTLTGTISGTNTGRTMTFTYTAAQQATDSTTHGLIYYRAYQLSETVERGYALEKAA